MLYHIDEESLTGIRLMPLGIGFITACRLGDQVRLFLCLKINPKTVRTMSVSDDAKLLVGDADVGISMVAAELAVDVPVNALAGFVGYLNL